MSERVLAHVAGEIVGRPLLILPEKLGVIADVLGGRIGLDMAAVELGPRGAIMKPEASRFVGTRSDPDDKRVWLPYALTENGAAVITITGSLVNRGAWVGASSGLTSYEGIRHQLVSAAADDRVGTIVLDIESPGGAAIGAFEIADLVRRIAAAKPVIAVVNGMAASAAYAIPSGASRIVTTPSGISGSIGVVMLHADYSRMLDRQGVTPTLLFAGAHKVDGWPYHPLSDEAKARLQASVDKTYDQFVRTVAAGRKGLSQKAIRATEALTYIGADAVEAGLADEVGTFESVIGSISRGNRPRTRNTSGATRMEDTLFTQAQLDAAVAQALAKQGATASETADAAVEADRKRTAGILALDEAKGRETTAAQLAAQGLSVDAAKAVLATIPKASSLAARAAGGIDLGGGGVTDPKSNGASTKLWDDIVDDLNAELKHQSPTAYIPRAKPKAA